MKNPGEHRSGAAIIIVLAVLTLVSVMIVMMAVGTRLEQQSAYYYQARQQASFFADEGTSYAQSLVEGILGDTNRTWWASSPGQLIFLQGTTGNASALTNIALSSGVGNTNQPGTFAPADLNDINRLNNERILDPQGTSLPLNWLYVRADGTFDTNQSPAILTNNRSPIVGRFAFWVDDESTRINLNTAWGATGNTNAVSHPSRVGLAALPSLTQAMADALHASALQRPFITPYEALSANASAAAALASNQFGLTHSSHDSEFTPWATPKIVLTTQSSALATTNQPYLNILKAPNLDPGSIANIDPTALQNTLSNIVSCLSRTNWPYVPGSASLTGKYYSSAATTNRVWQLALDIVEYVRCKESTHTIVDPITGIAGSFTTNTVNYQGNGFFGATRRTMLNEAAVTFRKLAPTATYQMYAVSVYYGFCVPTNCPVPLATLNGYYFSSQVFPVQTSAGAINGGIPVQVAVSDMGVNGNAHFYRAVTANVGYTNAIGASDPTNCFFRLSMQPTVAAIPRGDLVPLYFDGTTNNALNLPVTLIATVGDAPAKSLRASDPRVNKRADDWSVSTPNWTAFAAPVDKGGSPAQDRQGSSSTSAVYTGLYFPSPKGTQDNTLGLVTSIGELGYVSTGVECATNSTVSGTPYRTFRFQPGGNATGGAVPDWALTDIFTVPAIPGGGTTLRPYAFTVAGRVNPNVLLRPFPSGDRTNSLSAAFAGSTLSAATLSNITHKVFAANGTTYGGTNGLVSIGELSEIAGVSDQGEASEDTYRDLTAHPLTTRSDVFTIYTIGQALKQTPNGNLTLIGQQRLHTMIERYPTSTNGVGAFRLLYRRED